MPALDLVSEDKFDQKKIIDDRWRTIIGGLVVIGLVYFFTNYLKKTEPFQNATVDGEDLDEDEYSPVTSEMEGFSNGGNMDSDTLGLSEGEGSIS